MNLTSTEREAQRQQLNREELIERLARAIPEDGTATPLKGIRLSRSSTPGEAVYGTAPPSLCVIAQGSKEVSLGDERHDYDAHNYLLATVELPVAARVVEASKERPYLALRLLLDPVLVRSVMVETGQVALQRDEEVRGLTVSPLDATLMDVLLRLVRLFDASGKERFLLPLISREIVFHLLMGQQGDRVRHMAIPGGHMDRVSQAVEKIYREFSQPLRVEEIARESGMSVSGFHQHFKAVTAMSPLQFQKQLRLREARRLLINDRLDAATAGYRVGYDDASHFSRDYKRFFGAPPMRDVGRLREIGITADEAS
jgi:AraC-like DNA-binding protein